MGGSVAKIRNWNSWYDQKKRKILVLSFSKDNLHLISKPLTNKVFDINHEIGFASEEKGFNSLSLKFWVSKSIYS